MGGLGYVEDFARTDDDDGPPAMDGMPGIKRYYGKYRGTVLPIPDVERRGRLFVQVGDANGPNVSGWARPCVPWAGPSMGAYVVPPPGSKIWVEFEQGHPDYPIWVGCWWGSPAESPLIAKMSVPLAPIFALESLRKQAFVISDAPLLPYLPTGGILIGGPAACIAIDETGVRIFGLTVQVNGEPTGTVPMAAALLVTR
jgi:hypothetical protein